jgi:hypothetical protein
MAAMRCRRQLGLGVAAKLAVGALVASSWLSGAVSGAGQLPVVLSALKFDGTDSGPVWCSSTVETDGATTYCWRADMSASSIGTNDAAEGDALSPCPLALSLNITSAGAVQGAEIANIVLSVAINHDNALNSDLAAACSLSVPQGNVSAEAGVYYTDEPGQAATDVRATSIENATLSNDALSRWTSEGVVALQATVELSSQPISSIFVGRIVCESGRSSVEPATRYTFAVFGKLNRSVAASSVAVSEGGTTTAVALSDGQTLGMTGSQFTIAIVVVVVVLIGMGAAIVVWIRRRSRIRLKVQQGTESPVTGESNLRFSDWTQVYATHDELPSSILLDDCTTLAILRASVVSPTRHVADFTRDVAVWDERSSASPITPGSCILSSTSCESLSPANSFVLMESCDRVSLPLQEALQSLSDSEDERLEVDV